MLINTLLLIVFVGIVFSGLAVSTYLVGTEGTKRWIVYPVFSAICIGIFCFLNIQCI
ncbi:conserved domain protein [Parvimonas sp. oral taxon 393 str. F0440]|nr:conserved domain protein [Parvimonas sp. oral taxon 393 str. F0440]